MQTQRIVLGLAVAIGAVGVIAPASSQEYRGTWEQQMACTPDVWRLCGDAIPDVNRIVAWSSSRATCSASEFGSGLRIPSFSAVPRPNGRENGPVRN